MAKKQSRISVGPSHGVERKPEDWMGKRLREKAGV